MTEYTVHFQKGSRVGARSLRMIAVEAESVDVAIKEARTHLAAPGYRMVRVDHFENNHIVVDR